MGIDISFPENSAPSDPQRIARSFVDAVLLDIRTGKLGEQIRRVARDSEWVSGTSAKSSSLTRDEKTAIEDEVQTVIEGWSKEKQATARVYLEAVGMTRERARDIRYKAGMSQ